jgi:hypothetical protein
MEFVGQGCDVLSDLGVAPSIDTEMHSSDKASARIPSFCFNTSMVPARCDIRYLPSLNPAVRVSDAHPGPGSAWSCQLSQTEGDPVGIR